MFVFACVCLFALTSVFARVVVCLFDPYACSVQKRNATIEHMVAAQRENETRLARLKQEELSQVLT